MAEQLKGIIIIMGNVLKYYYTIIHDLVAKYETQQKQK
jgi:hypothetical protein